MEAAQLASDSENVAENGDSKPVAVGGAGDAATLSAERLRRKNKKCTRSNSKDGVSSPAPLPKYRNWKNSRRPRNGYSRGLPKKGGAGGKGVWGLPGSEIFEDYFEDANDPNYDSEAITNGDIEFKQVIVEAEPEEIIRKSEPVILEYFENVDTKEAIDSFREFVPSARSHLVLETIVEVALDHKPSNCESASFLISELYGRVFSFKDISYGFERLLERLPDLVLDTPEAATMLGNFIARCIADDCLPPCFVKQMKEADLNPQAKQAINRADTLLSMKHGMVRLDNIWGVGGGIRPVKFLIRQIKLLIKEFLLSGDLAEALRCVRALEVPHFHHEIVYESVMLVLELSNRRVDQLLCTLLAELWRSGIVTPEQMDRGFLRAIEDLSDIKLDVPQADVLLTRFINHCLLKFRLGEAVLKHLPYSRARKRFVSEGDPSVIKDHALRLRE